ncbi:hypothetical protein ACVMB3_003773 [Sinorhizobium meliloti]|uniref:hypothetical protein n=2 Tax=Rhizobium meliloti TaxID=382 RepID=UPI0002FDC66A|nr:hypothetical protein [Sinorhizobium meliloti]MCM5688844.1 hypothetical protein [Sinorhizobium meliloti]MDE3822714.1 hypothetical protein [Sinorhizobium meliloti]MDE4605325.1 hypothetical protein [Sinorhizobium meliloti]QND29497.1 hypothetical protein HB773_29330 [Sinorhizobium meliloti]QPI28680.1 hypothetical protein I0J99_20640 [Sinorhizobium meliloti]
MNKEATAARIAENQISREAASAMQRSVQHAAGRCCRRRFLAPSLQVERDGCTVRLKGAQNARCCMLP